jgi:hypothetical protein
MSSHVPGCTVALQTEVSEEFAKRLNIQLAKMGPGWTKRRAVSQAIQDWLSAQEDSSLDPQDPPDPLGLKHKP